MQRYSRNTRRAIGLVAVGTVALATVACSSDGGGESGGGKTTITVAAVANPQIEDLQSLAKEFEAEHEDITVKFSILPESQLQDKVTQDIATKSGQYDAVMLGPDQATVWAQNGWITNLSEFADADDSDYDVDDLIPSVREALSTDGNLYAVPFYSEGAFLTYRKDLFEAAGLTMPEQPTWTDILGFAEALNKPGEMAGICLRGAPTSGAQMVYTTMIDSFGGAWYDMDWKSTLDSPEANEAMSTYLALQEYGVAGSTAVDFPECLNAYAQGQAAMWYDATVGATVIEDPASSTVVGKNGYAPGPVEVTEAADWFWAWSFAIPDTSSNKDAAWEFISWATSKDYAQLVGSELGWLHVPPGTRTSTYEIPEYQEATAAFGQETLQVIGAVDIKDPGTEPRPYVGGGWLALPEGQSLQIMLAQEISAALAGSQTIDEALANAAEKADAAAVEAGRQK
jgi:sorbitol/mannitol transport system substrate-binding protein